MGKMATAKMGKMGKMAKMAKAKRWKKDVGHDVRLCKGEGEGNGSSLFQQAYLEVIIRDQKKRDRWIRR